MAISSRAAELRAAGEPVIGYGAGEPNFPTPEHVVEAAVAAARDPRWHKYSPASGLPDLRAAVAKANTAHSGFATEPANVVISPGGKSAVYAAYMALLDPGDEVLLPAPFWVTYPEASVLCDAVTVPIATTVESGFKVTVEQLDAAKTDRTKMLVFVSPSNPTGAVYSPAEVAEIGRWAAENGVWVLTDEIYDRLVYGDAEYSSMPAVAPEIADRCIVVNGVSKTYAMTGWRVGWLIAPIEVAKAVGRLQSHSTSNVANVSQMAALAALTGPQDAVGVMHAAFDRRRMAMHAALGRIPGVVAPEPEGAFYAYPDVEGLLGTDIGGRRVATSMELAALLLDEAKIAVVPGEAFGSPGSVRLSFALGDDDLAEGLERWRALVG